MNDGTIHVCVYILSIQCLACQHVFDVSQAFEQPSDEPQPLNSSSFAGRRRSLSKLLCPYCSSDILQYSMPGARYVHVLLYCIVKNFHRRKISLNPEFSKGCHILNNAGEICQIKFFTNESR